MLIVIDILTYSTIMLIIIDIITEAGMLKIFADKRESGTLEYLKDEHEFVFNYSSDNPVSLRMPYSIKSYISRFHIHPVFDMNMPEGYLFSLFKNLLTKQYGEINDFILFKHLSKSVEGYLTYENHNPPIENNSLNLDVILHSNDEDLFTKLVEQFLNRSAVSGVQPKVLASFYDKVALSCKEYIVKTFSDEYPHLAENEYFCMSALKYAGIPTPAFWISENKKFFVTEKFTYHTLNNSFYGFEEFCVLFDLNKEQKYNGSYEQIAKAIYKISTAIDTDLKNFYKMTVMNYLVKNGDAHLKNFGMLYTGDKKVRFLAPAYDVVCTAVYLPHDKPALTLGGKKVWVNKKTLIRFGVEYCMLDNATAVLLFDECIYAVSRIKNEIATYIIENPAFKTTGDKMIRLIDFSLNENLETTYKELPDGVL